MRFFLFVILLCLCSSSIAQQKFYFVSFKDKPNYKSQIYNPSTYISIRAIERRTRNRVPLNPNDVPPDSTYLAKISSLPLTMYGNSRWFNGTIVLSKVKGIEDSLKAFSFVEKVVYLGTSQYFEEKVEEGDVVLENQINILTQRFDDTKTKKDSIWTGRSYLQVKQLNDEVLLSNGINGGGVLIAVLDAGFKNLDKLAAFDNLFKEKKILSAYDFVEREEEVFEDDDHGLSVMSCLAANQPYTIMGTAPNANYLLLRTENSGSENLVEEYFWVLAAEYADSSGADIINSSLGYTKHDEKSMGHKYSELDGKTTIVTKAAEIASSKGILVVASAGNEGDDPWRQLSAPADGEHVLSVGAVDRYGSYAEFSSVGPTADKRQKPDLVALGKGVALVSRDGRIFEGNGTSYSCPIIAGLAAQLLQLAPNSPSEKLKEVLMLSSSHYFNPDKFEGFGLPNMELASKMIQVKTDSIVDVRQLKDLNLHAAIFSKMNQKIQISIEEPIKGEIERVGVNLKKGMNRFAIKGYKKGPSGLYHLRIDLANGNKLVYDFMKP